MSLTILFFGFLHALPVAYVALTSEDKSNDRILVTAVIISVVAMLTGTFKYILIDLAFIWGAYLMFANADISSHGGNERMSPSATSTTGSRNNFMRNLERNLNAHPVLRLPPSTTFTATKQRVAPPLRQDTPTIKPATTESTSIVSVIASIVVGAFVLTLLLNFFGIITSSTTFHLKPVLPNNVSNIGANTVQKPVTMIKDPLARPDKQAPSGSKPANSRGDMRHCLSLPTNAEINACASNH